MIILNNDLWLCEDCTVAAANDDFSGLDRYLTPTAARLRQIEIKDGLLALGPNLVANFFDTDGELEFSRCECDCCGTSLAGRRCRFALLRPETDDGLLDLGLIEAFKCAKLFFELGDEMWFIYPDRSVIRVSLDKNDKDFGEVVSGEIIAEEYVSFLEHVIRALGPDTIQNKLTQLRSKREAQ